MPREKSDSGSLDMLLDTLCNTFGGIILIALLLALSVEEKGDKLKEERRQIKADAQKLLEHETPDYEQEYDALLKEYNATVEQIEVVKKDLERIINDTKGKNAELKKVIEQYEEKGASKELVAESIRLKQLDMREELEALETESLTQSEEKARFETILEHDKLKKELDQIPYRKISLPIEKTTTAKKLNVIVMDGKIYPTMKVVDGRASIDETYVDWKEDEQKQRIATPKPLFGMHPEKNKDDVRSFLKSLQDSSLQFKKPYFLELIVFTDSKSFSAFNEIRDKASLLIIGYNWKPISEVPIVFGVSSAQGVIQN